MARPYKDPQLKMKEEAFQAAYSHWHNYKDKQSWDNMFLLVHEACKAAAIKQCQGANRCYWEDIEGAALDGACYCMAQIASGTHPQRLSSFVYLRVIQYTRGKQRQFEDKVLRESQIIMNDERRNNNYYDNKNTLSYNQEV